MLDVKSPTRNPKDAKVILHDCPKKPKRNWSSPSKKPFQCQVSIGPEGIAAKVEFGADTPEEVGQKLRAGILSLKGLLQEVGAGGKS